MDGCAECVIHKDLCWHAGKLQHAPKHGTDYQRCSLQPTLNALGTGHEPLEVFAEPGTDVGHTALDTSWRRQRCPYAALYPRWRWRQRRKRGCAWQIATLCRCQGQLRGVV